MRITVHAHAKINLNLTILGRRDDGYHELRTVFQALSLHDTLTFDERPGPFSMTCNRPDLPLDPSNLVWRASDALWRHLGKEGPVRGVGGHVEKRIPMRAGLGGGSADAAAALVGLARLWEPDLPPTSLVALGCELGADVPFFFSGGAALGLGRGDDIRPLPDLSPLDVVLVFPPFDVSTAEAFRWVDEDREAGEAGAPLAQTVPGLPWPEAMNAIANDFEPVVARRHPLIVDITGALRSAGATAAAMTGSGSTVFGLFERQDDEPRVSDTVGERAAHAAEALRRAGHSVLATRTLTRAEYFAASAPACL